MRCKTHETREWVKFNEQDSRAAHDIRVTTKIYPLMVESSRGGVIGGAATPCPIMQGRSR